MGRCFSGTPCLRCDGALHVACHAGGEKQIKVDQTTRPKIDVAFQSLGIFKFDGTAEVEITNTDTDGYVLLDAVQFVPQ